MCENGWFKTRLNYLSQRQNKRNSSIAQQSLDHEEMSNSLTENEDMEFLKHAIIEQANFKSIIEKLNSTRNLRRQMLLAKETDLRENFPFFFSHPKLVSCKYKLQSHNSISN